MKSFLQLIKEGQVWGNKSYPEVHLIENNHKLLPKQTYEIHNSEGEQIGAVVVSDIDETKNVIYSIDIDEEFRGKSYAVPTYVNLALKYGYICSGEYRNDGSLTNFVSPDADNVWKRLQQLFKVDKVPIQGDKFRYCLNSKNIK